MSSLLYMRCGYDFEHARQLAVKKNDVVQDNYEQKYN